MSKFALAYTGPETQRGIELLTLLKKFPQAMFVEKDDGIFEVAADTGFDKAIAAHPCWRANELSPSVVSRR